ncbi:MAG: haloalkane dehalogenase [bacterium]|nr:haloalkane dehalogenase [bacterium]
MKVLRTPDECFQNLPAYPFDPHYTEVGDGEGGTLRMHHVEAGPEDGKTVLCLHGELSWSYLYRKMLPRFAAAGYRAVASDLVGFGRSDKPAAQSDYSYRRHLDWLTAWMNENDLNLIHLVAHDWGGLLGLRLLAADPNRFARLVLANTFLPTGDQPLSEGFRRWRDYSQRKPQFKVGEIISRSFQSEVPPEVTAAYDAPFPDESYKAGVRALSGLVPDNGADPESAANRDAWETLKSWRKPTLTAFSDLNPNTRGLDKIFQKIVPGTVGQPHTTIRKAGHFLQEDQGEKLADTIIAFLDRASP